MKTEKTNTENVERPSRSQKKRESTALQKLGEELTKLPPAVLATFSMPEELADAIEAVRAMKGREAVRRQTQYIGRLMREHDVEALLAEYAAWKSDSAGRAAQEQEIEALRENLITGGIAMPDILARFPGVEEKKLAALVQQARRERAENAPPRAFRALYRYLREYAAPRQDG